MLEIQSRPGISPSGLQSLSRWAELEEKAANRLLQERLSLIQINREMGNRGVVERLLGREDKFQNPFYAESPGQVDPYAQSLSNLQKIRSYQNMLAGVNDMTAGQKSTMVKGPDGKMREVIDMTGKPTTSFESRPRWQQQQAASQGGLDVLMALSRGGVPVNETTIDRLININNQNVKKAVYDSSGKQILTQQGEFEKDLNNDIALSPLVVKQQGEAIKKYNASPHRKEQYLSDRTADEMKNHVINAFYEAISTTSDPMEIRRHWATAKNAIHGIDVAYNRKSDDDLLGPVSNYMPTGIGVGKKPMLVQIEFDDGTPTKMVAAPKNPEEGFDYNDWAEKKFKKKVKRAFPTSGGMPESSKDDAVTFNMVKQLVEAAASDEEARVIAEKFGYTIGPKRKILGFEFGRTATMGGGTVSNAADFMKKYNIGGK